MRPSFSVVDLSLDVSLVEASVYDAAEAIEGVDVDVCIKV
jgi:hypothetical protein